MLNCAEQVQIQNIYTGKWVSRRQEADLSLSNTKKADQNKRKEEPYIKPKPRILLQFQENKESLWLCSLVSHSGFMKEMKREFW